MVNEQGGKKGGNATFNHFIRKIVLGFMIASLSLFPLSGLAIASPEGEEKIRGTTNQLLRGVGQYHRAPQAEKQAALKDLKEIAGKRKALLLDLIEEDPGAFLLHALPTQARNRVPTEVQALIEEHLTVKGELTVLRIDDFDNSISTDVYRLTSEDPPGLTYRLHFAKNPPGLLSGSKVTARGVALDRHLVLAQGGGSSLETNFAAVASVTGDQRTLVLMVNFQDKSVSGSIASIESLMFTGTSSIDKYYREVSFNQLSLSGNVFGPYTIPYASSGCNYYSWAFAAEDAAAAAGVDVNSYPRRIFVMPSSGCNYIGLGTVGGNPSRSWIFNRSSLPDLYAHELGHNFGMRHASTPTNEYGDYSDIMGYSGVGLRHLNAPHKVEMEWLPSSRVQTVTASGTYQIALLETAGADPQAIKIAKPDTGEDYYFGYRRPVGFDASGLRSQFWDRTSVHRWSGSNSTPTYLLQVLGDGGTFNDSANALSVTQNSHDDTTATVTVSLTTPPCTPANPVVSVSPLSQIGSAGQTANYTVTVTNQDSSTCPLTSFGLSATLPSGWTSTFSANTLFLNPGASDSATWSVTSASGAPDASYKITAHAADTGDATHAGSKDATTVLFTDTLAPTVTITSPADGADLSKNIKVMVSATDDVGVTKVEITIDGNLKTIDTSSPYSYRWNMKKEALGSHTISAKAFDGAGHSASASISVNIVKGSKGGGGKGKGPKPK